MSTTAISSVSSPLNGVTTDVASRVTTKALGQNDFLKLLVAQMTHQDPLNPQGDTEFIAQMAQFSALEQSKAMQSDMASLQATSLLGQQVTITPDPDSENQNLITGQVTAVQMKAGKPQLVVNGETYDISRVSTIELPSTQTSN